MSNLKFWSCKLKKNETLKGHKSIEAATKSAGDHGFVYCLDNDTVYQAHEMANGKLKLFDVVSQKEFCNTGGFDMREAMIQIGYDLPIGKNSKSLDMDKEEDNVTKKICEILEKHNY